MNTTVGSPISIRLATAPDALAIAAAEAETARHPGLLIARSGEIPIEAYRSKIVSLTTRGRYIVAEMNGCLMGHAFLDPMELEANAHVFRLNIVVHPGFLGRGVGAALMTDLLDWAKTDAKVGKVELLVRSTNERAIHLYRSFGFVNEGSFQKRVRLADGTFIDDLAMAWYPV